MRFNSKWIILATFLWVSVLYAGYVRSQSLVNGLSAAQVQSLINSSLTSYAPLTSVPTPLTSVPPGPNASGTAGSAGTYVPGNAMQRQAVQRTVTTTDSNGNFSVTWNTSFISTTPTVVVQAGNPGGTQPIDCNWTTRSQTGVSGTCFQAGTVAISLAILPLTVNIFSTAPATNTPISVIMAEPTQ